MLVVADSSPLIVLINIGHIDILPRLFRTVIIPPEVSREMSEGKRPQLVRTFIATPPAWLVEQAPTAVEPIPMLHPAKPQRSVSLSKCMRISSSSMRLSAAKPPRRAAFTSRVRLVSSNRLRIMVCSDWRRLSPKSRTPISGSPELLDLRLKLHLERKKDHRKSKEEL